MTVFWNDLQCRGIVAVSGVVSLGIAALLAAVAVGNPSDFPSWRWVVFAPLMLLVVLVAMSILVLRPWRYWADMEAMRAGRAWVHWTYDAAAWRAANRYDEQRNAFWVHGSLIVMGLGGLVLLLGFAGGEQAVAVGAMGGLLAFMALIVLTGMMVTDPVRVARRAARGEIYISRHGIYRQPGGYTALDAGTGTIRYESADLVDRPTPHIHIEVSVKFDPAGTGGSWVRKTLTDVGVPAGHEDEARTLVDLLRRHVLTSSPPTRASGHKWAPREPLDHDGDQSPSAM